MKKILICQHGGSGNHGCEALARTVCGEIRRCCGDAQITLYSYARGQDEKYLSDIAGLRVCGLRGVPGKYSPHNFVYHMNRLLGRPASKLPITDEFRRLVEESDLVIAIGGDNYCYNMGQGYYPVDRYIRAAGKKYMLLGCSVEPEDLRRGLASHLSLFDLISVRESITYDAMRGAGMENAVFAADTAFLMQPRECALPRGLEPENAVGLNLSPLVIKNESAGGVTMENFRNLALGILEKTDMQLALIPHVVWKGNDDRTALRALAESLPQNGRVFTVEDAAAPELKSVISRLRFFVGARTHSTIAAYSSGVPTLTLGYSVKARGIARDLFGAEEGYVVPVQGLKEPYELRDAFFRIMEREEDMRAALAAKLPETMRSAERTGELIRELLEAPPRERKGIYKRRECCGCGACAAVCPQGCIEMRRDENGFLYPETDADRCTDCGRCREACFGDLAASGETRTYAAAARDGAQRAAGTSGGVFSVLAADVLARGGAVLGAAFDGDMSLRHVAVTEKEALAPLCGSKYVQSDITGVYDKIGAMLGAGRPVLFCGTPCQTAAVRQVFGAAEGLLLADVACHGVPSPRLLGKYVKELEARFGGKMTSLNFRDKRSGWESSSVTASFEGGGEYCCPGASDSYTRLFLANLPLRLSCYYCIGKERRAGDLTLGDFWGISKLLPDFERQGGVSLLIVRTAAGAAALERVRDALELREADYRAAVKYNPCVESSVVEPMARMRFFDELDAMDTAQLAAKYIPAPSRLARVKRLAARLLGRA